MSGMHRNRLNTGRASKKRLSFQRKIQLLSAVFVNGYAAGFQKGKIFTGGTKAVCLPVLNCYSCPGALGACPVGSLQTALGGADHHFPFYVLGLLMLFGIVLGRVICGLLCPFGLIQDLLHKIPVPKRKLPTKIDRPARYLKYMILLTAVILLPAFAVTETGVTPPYFCKYICPAGTLEGGIPLLLKNESLRQLAGGLFRWKTFLLALILLSCIVIFRPFCRFLCPLGAFYGLFSRFSLFGMRIDEKKCSDCGACIRHCRMDVKKVGDAECIQCGECIESCPTRALRFGKK